jgi:hypothetical protein
MTRRHLLKNASIGAAAMACARGQDSAGAAPAVKAFVFDTFGVPGLWADSGRSAKSDFRRLYVNRSKLPVRIQRERSVFGWHPGYFQSLNQIVPTLSRIVQTDNVSTV